MKILKKTSQVHGAVTTSMCSSFWGKELLPQQMNPHGKKKKKTNKKHSDSFCEVMKIVTAACATEWDNCKVVALVVSPPRQLCLERLLSFWSSLKHRANSAKKAPTNSLTWKHNFAIVQSGVQYANPSKSSLHVLRKPNLFEQHRYNCPVKLPEGDLSNYQNV